MLKIIHGADFHLDSPFAGLSPERAAQRRGEQRELLDRLAGLAREKQADLVLLAGDLLDSERVFRETAQALRAALAAIPCPVFIAPGNHDFYSPRSVWTSLDWPENVHIFTSDALEAVELPGCTLWGRAFSDAHQTACPLEGLAVPGDGRLHIACVHGCVGTGNDYGPITPGEIAASGLDYLALGHVHQGSGLQREGGTWWAYPGCPEGRGFDETGEKGVLYVEAEPGRVTAQFVPLAKVRYEIITADITGPDGALFNILEALPGKTSDLICRLILTGEGDAPNLANLQQTLAPEFYGLTLIDRTRLPQDLWARREEDALTGLFLRTMWDKCQGEPDNPLWQLAARYGLAALEGGEEV
ncbi:MAG: DNA repair exonuclease [Lawsonibacter sp.]|jgi:exonuclease SbcD|uniref:metallophosphoesterase family protein n=1 Tax=Lawsonibacter sp. JLR.KK007 TaxID=3114293 RepID=UPI00216C8C79|nr:DNA repair exonuclease [Lawsonibacter sp.]MCI8991013.1 DNA repair exonuclease [Lawsonibacter sp.]MCI9269019.1 DNA repair exonuclease [Lawsonibacter sp.]